mgnify:FL=1|jgi:hypothetical protein
MFRVVCAKWGNLYTEDDVNSLYEKVKRNCSVDFEFECFDNLDDSWEQYKLKHYRASAQPTYRREEIQNGYHRDDFGGIPHYRKITMFEADKKFNSNDTLLYLDLDTNISGDLAYFFEELNNEKPYLVWNYWYEGNDGEEWKRQYHITRCPLFNSSVMVWKPGQNKPIYDFVLKHIDACFFTYPSMDTFMFHQFGPYSYGSRKNHFQYYNQGIVTTQKVLKEYEKPGIIHMLEGLSHEEKKKWLT